MNDILDIYMHIQHDINARLHEFRLLGEVGSDQDIFAEMCFCTSTPQTNAKKAYAAVSRLKQTQLLIYGSAKEIALVLQEHGVRFHNHKAAYMIANRQTFFPDTRNHIMPLLQAGTIRESRALLADTVAGWGLKEASHFLRNIGYGSAICILDRHILRQLAGSTIIDAVPKTVSKQLYLAIEQKMIRFADDTSIPVDALDLLFWYQEKQEIFR